MSVYETSLSSHSHNPGWSIHRWPSLTIVDHRWPSLTISIHRWPSLTSLTIVDHRWPSLTITDHHWPSLTIIDHHWPSLTIIDHHWQSLTIIDHRWPSLAIINHHWSWLTIIDHPWPSLTINRRISPAAATVDMFLRSYLFWLSYTPRLGLAAKLWRVDASKQSYIRTSPVGCVKTIIYSYFSIRMRWCILFNIYINFVFKSVQMRLMFVFVHAKIFFLYTNVNVLCLHKLQSFYVIECT